MHFVWGMIRTLSLISTVVVLLLIAALLSRYGEPRLCINATIVEKVSIRSKTGGVEIPNCSADSGLRRPQPVVRAVAREVDEAADRVAQFLRMAPGLKPFKFNISIRLDRPFLYQISESQIELGADILDAEGQLTKAIVTAVLLREQPSIRNNLLAQEILSDILIQAAFGEVPVVDPISNRSTKAILPLEQEWVRFPEPQICRSPWKPAALYSVCARDYDRGFSGTHISQYSLRGFVTRLAQQKITEMGLSSRLDLIRKILTSDMDISVLEKHRDGFSTLGEYLQTVSQTVRSLLFEQLGINVAIQPETLAVPDLLVEVHPTANATYLRGLKSLSVTTNKRIYVLTTSGTALYPEGRPLEIGRSIAKAKRRVFIGCTNLPANEILKRDSEDDRLLHIRTCEFQKSLRLDTYLQNGIGAFSQASGKVPFVLYHLPSVKLAAKYGLPPKAIISEKLSPKLVRVLGLKQAQKRDNSYFIPGPLSAIEWFRL